MSEKNEQAARLRDAARVLRERATASKTGGEWEAFRAHVPAGFDAIGVCDQTDDVSIYEDRHSRPCDAEYISTVSPVFGLAVAEWLEQEAENRDQVDAGGLGSYTVYPDHALAVADAVLVVKTR